MSQGEAAPFSPQRHASLPPIGNEQAARNADRAGSHPGHEDRAPVTVNGNHRAEPLSGRPLGVQNILNPPESRQRVSEADSTTHTHSHDSRMAAHTSVAAYSASRPYAPSPPSSRSHPGTPIGPVMHPDSPHMSDRAPSPSVQGLPALNNPRGVLSPRLPRASSVGYGPAAHDYESRRSQPLPSMSPAKRPYESDRHEEARNRLPSFGPRSENHHPRTSLAPSPNRAHSQPPVLHSGGLPTLHHPHPHPMPPSLPSPGSYRDKHVRPPSLSSEGSVQYASQPSRPLSTSSMAGDRGSHYGDHSRRPGVATTLPGDATHRAFMTLPGSDIPIPVEVDYSQASKKADEKRQRNAKASTRHRRKKKTLQEENLKENEVLREERDEMMKEMESLTRQRDFYRDERNRLRDVVARTSPIRDLAHGPRSPSPTNRLATFAQLSPPSRSMRMDTPSGYGSESSSNERPTQRRKVEDRPDYSIPALATSNAGPGPGPLPMPGQPFSRPSSASSTGSMERLPPLRTMEVLPPPTRNFATGQRREQDPTTGQWVPAQRRQVETGWATAARMPADGHPR